MARHQYHVTQSRCQEPFVNDLTESSRGLNGVTSYVFLEEGGFHISLVTLGQAGCKQKLQSLKHSPADRV